MSKVVEVARRAGVSQATVSRVVSGQTNVRQSTRDRVMRAVEELGYQPSSIAQAFRLGKSKTVAFLVGDIEQGWYSALAKQVQIALEKVGFDLLLYDLGHSEERLQKVIQRSMASQVQCIVLATSDRFNSASLKGLSSANSSNRVKLFSLGRRLDEHGIPSISHDDAEAAAIAVNHLLERGCKAIAYLGRTRESAVGRERYEGYLTAFRAKKIEPASHLLWNNVGYRFEGGYDLMVEALKSRRPVDAVIAGSDELALGAMKAALDHGLNVPDDISFIGFGNLAWGKFLNPALTTLSGDAEALANHFVDQLLDEQKPLTLVKRKLIVRQSS